MIIIDLDQARRRVTHPRPPKAGASMDLADLLRPV